MQKETCEAKNFIIFDLIRVCKQSLCIKSYIDCDINAKNDTCAFAVQNVSHKERGTSETMLTR